jgi:hypothetical protein
MIYIPLICMIVGLCWFGISNELEAIARKGKDLEPDVDDPHDWPTWLWESKRWHEIRSLRRKGRRK